MTNSDLNNYDYFLPENLIAQKPVEPRDSSRLLVLHRKDQRWEHRNFRDLPEFLDSNDLIVANNTRVLRARLQGRRIRSELQGESYVNPSGEETFGGKVECLLLEEKDPLIWEALFHASARYVPGLRFQVPTPDGRGLTGELVRGSKDSPSGTVVVRFDRDPEESGAGEVPLPHYIGRGSTVQDDQDYQTVYAKLRGSAAAPTAGLHFTPELIASLKAKHVTWEEVTLHVGLGTFRPVKEQDLRKHIMHEERYEVSLETARTVTNWKRAGKRVLAVGTTSARTLESAWQRDGESSGSLREGAGRTTLFIRPGNHSFGVVDRLLTNFHLPKSTLLMLVSTLAGRDFVLAAYEEAVREKYRFFSYGDAMLIL